MTVERLYAGRLTAPQGWPSLGYKFALGVSETNMTRILIATWFLIAFFVSPTWADFDAGVSAYKRGEYTTALIELRTLAEQGDASSQFYLGQMYANGQGVLQNYTEAIRWYQKAAVQGIAEAQVNLGVMYHKGLGVVQNTTEALRWYNLAALQGESVAQYNIGLLFLGEYRLDYEAAARWILLSANQGHAMAQGVLGGLYQDGKGVPRDYVMAYMWYNLAAAQGVEVASSLRDKLTRVMTPSQVAEAQRLSREWKPKK